MPFVNNEFIDTAQHLAASVLCQVHWYTAKVLSYIALKHVSKANTTVQWVKEMTWQQAIRPLTEQA